MSNFPEFAIWFVLSLLSGWLVYRALSCLIQVKNRRWCKGLLLFVCWLAISMVILIGDLFNLSVGILIFLSCLWITCEGSRLKRITIGLMIASTVFAFNGFLDNSVNEFMYYFVEGFEMNVMLNTSARAVFALLLYLEAGFHRPERDFELSGSYWRLMLTLTFPPLGIVISLILLRSPYSPTRATMLADAALFLIAVISFAGLLWAVKVLNRQRKLEQENALALHNQKYYEAMEQQQFEIRRLRHDLANHLQVLLSLPERQKNRYIEEMLGNPAFVQALAYCGDATVNAVLTAKGSMMRQKNIRFYVKADIGEPLPFEKADICALFANALDNAAEACMKLEEARREVSLDARAGKGLLAVSVKNSYAAPEGWLPRESSVDTEKSQILKTTKKDTVNHGFGLQSIRETVKKYGGNMEIRRKENTFILFLYLPLCEGQGR